MNLPSEPGPLDQLQGQDACPKCRKPLGPAGVCVSCLNKNGLILAIALMLALPLSLEIAMAFSGTNAHVQPRQFGQRLSRLVCLTTAAPFLAALLGAVIVGVYCLVQFAKSNQSIIAASAVASDDNTPRPCPLCGTLTDQAGTCRRCWVRQSLIAGLACLFLSPYLSFSLLILSACFRAPDGRVFAVQLGALLLVFSGILLAYAAAQSGKAKRENLGSG